MLEQAQYRWAERRVTRRNLEIALGSLWLLDGALQFQPYMFTSGFFAGMLGMANMGLPGPLSNADYHLASMLAAHPGVWNSLFAGFQVLLGVGLLWRRSARAALALSVPWALGVWAVGEGFGASFMGGTSLLTGAPGAALVYALVAVVLWPGPRPRVLAPVPSRLAARFALVTWALIWVGSALLEFGATNHAAGVPAAQISDTAQGQFGPMRAFNQGIARLLEGHGGSFAVVLGIIAVAIGLGVLAPRARPAALVAGVIVAVFVGFVGQDLGGLFSGQATDPGSGPPLVLLALALWVVTRTRSRLDLRLDALQSGPHAVAVGATTRPPK